MKKIPVKELIDFRSKGDIAKKSFVTRIKLDKPQEGHSDGGGDYWIPCISAIRKSFKQDNLLILDDKVIELKEKVEESPFDRTKIMFNRNIGLLDEFKKLGIKKLKPKGKLTYLKTHPEDKIISIKGLNVQALPCHVYTFEKDETVYVSAIWFIAKIEGYSKAELGMFVDVLYRYLKATYSADYTINTDYCIAIDVFLGNYLSYTQLKNGECQRLLSPTLDEINKLM